MSIRIVYWRQVIQLVAAAFVWHRLMQTAAKMTTAERRLFDAVSALRADINWAERPVNSNVRFRKASTGTELAA